MRNILEYPITADEIERTLTRLAEQGRQRVEESGIIGDMTVLVLQEAIKRLAELEAALNVPEVSDFVSGVQREAAHQRERWGEAHDRSKSAENWYWLVGYLAGKALRAHVEGGVEKAKHHTISAAAALSQWHEAISRDASGRGIGEDADLRP